MTAPIILTTAPTYDVAQDTLIKCFCNQVLVRFQSSTRNVGARLLFMPPNSPDLNPIEQVFAKLKHLMRKAAERTHETTWRRIGSLLENFPSHECSAYLKNSGYGAA
jgi:hypothetical protein